MEIIIASVVFSALVGLLANSKGRSGIGWTVLCLLISPILGVIILLIVGDVKKDEVY